MNDLERWDRGKTLLLESLYKPDIKLRGCADNQGCFDELMNYYADEMQYGVMKARTGMPDEWIFDKLCELGIDEELEQKQDLAKHYRWKGMI